MAEQVGVKAAAEQLGLHDSPLYGWRSKAQAAKARGEVNDEMAKQIVRLRRQLAEKEQELAFLGKAAAFTASKGRNGAPRITEDLAEKGHRHDRKTIAKSLKRQGLRARAARRFKATNDSRHSLPMAANLLEQEFTASAPDQKWVSDITYLWTDEGWRYLAVVLDLYSRKVIGWPMHRRM